MILLLVSLLEQETQERKKNMDNNTIFSPSKGAWGMAARVEKTNSNFHIAGARKRRIVGPLDNLPLFTIRKFVEIKEQCNIILIKYRQLSMRDFINL
jgi:hypothetical protein